MLFTIKFTDWVIHNNPMYRILSQKFGQISVNGPNQAKNDIFFFFTCSPAGVCYMEAGYQFFRKDQGCTIYRCHH